MEASNQHHYTGDRKSSRPQRLNTRENELFHYCHLKKRKFMSFLENQESHIVLTAIF